jgi:catechol 2,3-dioxygenase-like lactoylglutathione lyase family enzyme
MTTPAIEHIGQLSLYIRDPERTTAFYRDVLGLKHLYTFGNLVFFEVGDTRLFLSLPEQGDWRESSTVYFQVPDIQAAWAAVTANSATVESPPHMIHRWESGLEEWMAFFKDPDGNMLAFMAQVPAPAS